MSGIWWYRMLCRVSDLGPVRREREADDRGDVPGWVLVTVMSAIVVVALLTVFRDQVTDAVTEAFNRVRGASD